MSTNGGPLGVTSTGGGPLLRLVRVARRSLERFLHIEASSGLLLLSAAAVAMIWANSAWAASYARVFHAPATLRVGTFAVARSLEWIVNDALMVIFFFVVGLEIRREVHRGELSEWRRAALPAAAALGGMVVPALLYLTLAGAPETRGGWGVPMATDIAFAVGILTLLGKRVPAALRVLLLALAVIDDLGAIIVIAIFYSPGVSPLGLLAAAGGILGILAMQALGIRKKVAYLAPALAVWGGVYAAGIHPTIAGVVVGMMTPVTSADPPSPVEAVSDRHNSETGTSPAEGLIEALHPWVAFVVMPLFALANAGVSLSGLSFGASPTRVAVAVAFGLVVGKPLGIFVACKLALRIGVATLPAGLGSRHLVVLGVTAGIGFTMALFVGQLAFVDPTLLAAAKFGVLCASATAAIAGLLIGRALLAPVSRRDIAQSADEAESSTEL